MKMMLFYFLGSLIVALTGEGTVDEHVLQFGIFEFAKHFSDGVFQLGIPSMKGITHSDSTLAAMEHDLTN